MNPSSLKQLREKVEEVDRNIINLIFQRQRVVSEISKAKHAARTSVPTFVPAREKEVYRRILAYARSQTTTEAEEIPPQALTAIYREIMSLSMYSQTNPVFAYVTPSALQHVVSPPTSAKNTPCQTPNLPPSFSHATSPASSSPAHIAGTPSRTRRYPLLPAYEPTPVHPRLAAPPSPPSPPSPQSPPASRSPSLGTVTTSRCGTDAVETLDSLSHAGETDRKGHSHFANNQRLPNRILHPLFALKQRFGSSVTTLPIYCTASADTTESSGRCVVPQGRYLESLRPYTAMRDALHAGAATYGLIPLSSEGLGPVTWANLPRFDTLAGGNEQNGHNSRLSHTALHTQPRTYADARACGGVELWADMVAYEAVVETGGKHGAVNTKERSAAVEAQGVTNSVVPRTFIGLRARGERKLVHEATKPTAHATGKAAMGMHVCEESAGLRIANVMPGAGALHIVCGVRGGELQTTPVCAPSAGRESRQDEYVLVGKGVRLDAEVHTPQHYTSLRKECGLLQNGETVAEEGRIRDGKQAELWVGHGSHILVSTSGESNRVLIHVVEQGSSRERVTNNEQWLVVCTAPGDVCVGCLCAHAILSMEDYLNASEGKRYVVELSNVWPPSHDFL